MAFYIHFNNFSSFLDEPGNHLNTTLDVPATVTDLVEKETQDVSINDQPTVLSEPETSIVFEVENSAELAASGLPEFEEVVENPILVIETGETAAVHQIAPIFELDAKASELATEPKIPATETKVAVRNDNYEKYHSLLKKFELSLRYRYDFTDVLKNNRETENYQNLGRLNEKNARKQRDRQRAVSERRFQEKQAENFKESLKQKLFASQLQNKSK